MERFHALTYNCILYASYTGFSVPVISAPQNAGPYEPENVESIEFGFKTNWLDNTLQFNGTFFTTDYEQKQEDVVLPDPVAVTDSGTERRRCFNGRRRI